MANKKSRLEIDMSFLILILVVLLFFVLNAFAAKPMDDLHMRVEHSYDLTEQYSAGSEASVWYDWWMDKDQKSKLDSKFKTLLKPHKTGIDWQITVGFEF